MSNRYEICRMEIIYKNITICYSLTIRLIFCITGALLPNDPMIFLTNKLQKPVQNSLLIGCLHLQKIRRLKVPTNTAKIKEDMA